MRKKVTLLSLLLLFGVMVQAQVQYPVNGNFENWTTASFAGQTYDSLVGFDTPQRLATALAVPDTVTYRTTDASDGSAAVLMISKEVTIAGLLTVVVPGSISTGTFFVNLFTQEFGVTGGAFIDCKPTELTGFYKYAPAGVDTANIVVLMTDAAGDTICDVTLQLDDATTGGYQPFTLPLVYTGSTAPTLVQILITSSGVGGQDGSTLYADNVVLRGGDCVTGLFDAFSQPQAIEIVPNPAADAVRFNLPLDQNAAAAIMDLSGRTVLKINAVPGMNQVDVSQLANGVYVLRVAENGKTVYSGKFEKF
jgi:hypothetical protein